MSIFDNPFADRHITVQDGTKINSGISIEDKTSSGISDNGATSGVGSQATSSHRVHDLFTKPDVVELPYDHHKFGLRVSDSITIDPDSALKIVELAELAKAGLGELNPNTYLGSRYMRNNNAVYRDFPNDSIVKSDRYRLADAYGKAWSGPVRTLGMLRQNTVSRLVGYVVSMKDLLVVPNFERHLSLPPSHTGNFMNRTFMHHTHLVKVGTVYQNRSVDLDVSVSTMVEAEGRYLRNTVSASNFTHDVLRLAQRIIDRYGSFLGNNIDKHQQALYEGIVAYCCKHAARYIDDAATLNNVLPIVTGAYNMASYGQEFRFLSSQIVPDPIKVGNEGDSIGNIGIGGEDDPLSGKLLNVLSDPSGLWDALKDILDIDNKSGSGLQKSPPIPKHGWAPGQEPKADGGMVWNTFHLQSSPWLDGTLLTPPGVAFTSSVRACFFDRDQIASIRSAAIAGANDLELSFKQFMDEDYVFIPVEKFEYGDEDLIRQDGVEINLLVDRYDPVLDEV